MNGAFYIGATGLQAQERALEVVANNVANLNTTAFKRSEVRFAELVGAPPSASDPKPIAGSLADLMSGVTADASPRVFAQGELRTTGKALDLAISGDGFIEVLGPAGQVQLWRGGTLKINADGYLATDTGLTLKAMIAVPNGASALTIDASGKVQATVNGAATATDIGKLELVLPKDLTQLSALGDGLYQAQSQADLVSAAPGEDGAGTLTQGSLETSNVQLSDEMVTLMIMQRAYAANAQIIQAGDQLMAIANGLKR
ncbi:MAG: flagellar hook-basal body protein [Caulobacteraceae bacterium]|nr:flagellar hook-basal body protein [Caulobacteraceae bacterium]